MIIHSKFQNKQNRESDHMRSRNYTPYLVAFHARIHVAAAVLVDLPVVGGGGAIAADGVARVRVREAVVVPATHAVEKEWMKNERK